MTPHLICKSLWFGFAVATSAEVGMFSCAFVPVGELELTLVQNIDWVLLLHAFKTADNFGLLQQYKIYRPPHQVPSQRMNQTALFKVGSLAVDAAPE